MAELEAVDTLIDARWVIPVNPARRVLDDHSVAVRDGRIVAVLPRTRAQAAYIAAERVSLPKHALIPGMVNLHTHASMALMRGFADDMPLMQWLQDRIWPAEASTCRRSSSTTAPCSPAPRCCAAASPASTRCISIPAMPRGLRSIWACARRWA